MVPTHIFLWSLISKPCDQTIFILPYIFLVWCSMDESVNTCSHICRQTCMYAEAWIWCVISSLFFLLFIYWDRFSIWTQSSSISYFNSAILLLSHPSNLSSAFWVLKSLMVAMSAFLWILGIQTLVLIFLWQMYDSPNHLFSNITWF